MSSQPSQQVSAERVVRMPVGTIGTVDPLNWLSITWNTMKELVHPDERGHVSSSPRPGSVGALVAAERIVER